MKKIIILCVLLLLACGSVTESVAPKILNIWQNTTIIYGLYDIDAYMSIEGQGNWYFVLTVGDYFLIRPQSPGDYDKDSEGTVWTTFSLNSQVYPAGTSYIITGYHGGDSMTYEGVLP